MHAEYHNWIPARLIRVMVVISLLLLIGLAVLLFYGPGFAGTRRLILTLVVGAAAVISLILTGFWIHAYRAFSYTGKRQLSRQIVEGTAAHVQIPEGGVGLDVGCGSGALTIAAAKLNPQASFIGVDPWGFEYEAFNKAVCEQNARAEGVSNVSFQKGNAVSLDFPDESFDAVMSNYVYHNIPGVKKQDLLRETLRVLKKGGSFALHDLMSKRRYGDMEAFMQELREAGYERVELIPTGRGLFMTAKEERSLMLFGSALLVGKK